MSGSAKGVTAAKVKGRKFIRNRGYGGRVGTADAFTFKLNQAPADNGGIYLIIQASEGQSNGVSRGYGKAVQIAAVAEPEADVIDIKADYESKHGLLNTGAPKVFFKYFFVNSQTGEASVPMQALATYAEADGE